MKKWEYCVERSDDAPGSFRLEDWLNQMGDEGWELCGIRTTEAMTYYTFKREKESE